MISSLVLFAQHCCLTIIPHKCFIWTARHYTWEAMLASLSAIALVLAFSALQWNKTKELLIPVAVMAPILSLDSLVFAILVLVEQPTSAEVIVIALLSLLEATLAAYYWLGLINLYVKYQLEREVSEYLEYLVDLVVPG